MPAWIHQRAERLMPEMKKQYGEEKGEQVAFATATQMAHKVGKSPKTFVSKQTGKKEPFGTPEGKRAAKMKFDKPRSEYKKTASVVMFDSFSDELLKIALEKNSEMGKEAISATLKSGWKALKSSVPGLGKKELVAAPGILQPQRQQAVQTGKKLMGQLEESGVNIQRARVKAPESIAAKGLTSAPDDLLGMQMYAKSPEEVAQAVGALRRSGVSGLDIRPKVRQGYHGINIKGVAGETPMELQLVPGVRSNIGQQMEHTLGYKVNTEAPGATAFDKWVGKEIAPKMVSSGSWLNDPVERGYLDFIRARVAADKARAAAAGVRA